MWHKKRISKDVRKKEFELNLSFYGSKIDEYTEKIKTSINEDDQNIWKKKLIIYSNGYNKIVKDYNKTA